MSKLINQSRLQKFAEGFWDKVKRKYDNAFVGAEITASTETEKKIKFTKAGGGDKVDVSLADYARLQDRNPFKKDVTVDNADYISTLTIGHENGTVAAANRTTGYRRLTNKNFTDRYISHLRVYVPSETTGQSTQAHAWIIKKGETKSADTLLKRIGGQEVNIVTSGSKKYFDIPVNEAFEHEVFFVIRTNGQEIVGINNIQSSLISDAININDSFNLNDDSIGSTINWNGYELVNDKIGYMELHGRTGIVDINKKLKEIEGASGTYVKYSETVNTGGRDNANKVVKLDDAGKLNKDMLPAIAINEFITISSTSFDENSLNGKEYQNGDIIFNSTTQKRYLCIDRDNTTFLNRFVELNSKDGSVVSVNARSGAITLDLVSDSADNKLKLKIAGDGGNEVVKEIEMISEDEITNMINTLPN